MRVACITCASSHISLSAVDELETRRLEQEQVVLPKFSTNDALQLEAASVVGRALEQGATELRKKLVAVSQVSQYSRK